MQKIPDYLTLSFKKSSHRDNTYDLVSENKNAPFKYFVVTEPKQERFIKQGARWILESWEHRTKVLFTGLIPISENKGYYVGDHLNVNGKKSMLIAFISPDQTEITVYYFRSFNKYPKLKKLFISQFIGICLGNNNNNRLN